MNKKYLKIALIIIVTTIVGLLVYNYLVQAKIKNEIEHKSIEAVEKWANFSDPYSQDYINSLKPFLTNEKYNNLSDDAANTREMNQKYGILPTGSTFDNIEVKSILKEKDKFLVLIEGSHKYSTDQEASTRIAEVVFVESNGDWFINEIYFEG